jgi:hypothetical protein
LTTILAISVASRTPVAPISINLSCDDLGNGIVPIDKVQRAQSLTESQVQFNLAISSGRRLRSAPKRLIGISVPPRKYRANQGQLTTKLLQQQLKRVRLDVCHHNLKPDKGTLF